MDSGIDLRRLLASAKREIRIVVVGVELVEPATQVAEVATGCAW